MYPFTTRSVVPQCGATLRVASATGIFQLLVALTMRSIAGLFCDDAHPFERDAGL